VRDIPKFSTEALTAVFEQGLPFHYIELATDLCKYAREDLQDWNLSYDLVVSAQTSLSSSWLFKFQNVDGLHIVTGHDSIHSAQQNTDRFA